MWPKSIFCAHMWLRSDSVNSTNHIIVNLTFTIPICVTSKSGNKSDTGQMFCNATAFWTVMSDFMQLLGHSRSTFEIIPQLRETLQRFYTPKVIRRFAKGNQWKCDLTEPGLDWDKKNNQPWHFLCKCRPLKMPGMPDYQSSPGQNSVLQCYSDNTIYKQNMRSRIIKVLKLCCLLSHPCFNFSYCLCIITLASAADQTINKRIITYFMSSMFTSVWQSAAQVLPNPQYPNGIGLLFPLLPWLVFQLRGLTWQH